MNKLKEIMLLSPLNPLNPTVFVLIHHHYCPLHSCVVVWFGCCCLGVEEYRKTNFYFHAIFAILFGNTPFNVV